MSFLSAPPWIQVALAAEALAVAWLTARFGWRGLVWSLVGGVAFWLLFGLFASYLVGRLEGGGAAELSGLLSGAVLGAVRLAQAGTPLLLAAAAAGGLARWGFTRRKAELR